MAVSRIATVALIAMSVTACVSAPPVAPIPDYTQLKRYEAADPIADCQRAIARRDFAFLGIGGFTTEFPGVPEFKRKYWHRYSHRVIEGTGEFMAGREHLRLQAVASRYAAHYNRFLLSYLRSHNAA